MNVYPMRKALYIKGMAIIYIEHNCRHKELHIRAEG